MATKTNKSKEKQALFLFPVDREAKVGKALALVKSDALLNAWKKEGHVEACSDQPKDAIHVFDKSVNLLAQAVHTAFYQHYPLILSPDIIWLTIAQGFANHISQDSEGMRKNFVDFKDKKTITILRPDFVKGSSKNDWSSVFPSFTQAIQSFVGKDIVETITCDFSTSGPVERIVSQICLMDTVQHYFEYVLCGGCGIPSIGLRGSVDDWKKVKAKAETLKVYELDWWLKELLPVLDQFIAAAACNPDTKFWRAICNFSGSSGFNGDPISGWLQVFFPYLNASGPKGIGSRGTDSYSSRRLRRNDSIGEYWKSYKSGVTAASYKPNGFGDTGCGYATKLENIPPSLSSAPFTYVDQNTKKSFSMEFMGGITSIIQHSDTLALEPIVGWSVIDKST